MQKPIAKLLVAFAILGSGLTITGCESLSYYSQAAQGQMALLTARQSVSQLIAADETDARLRAQLTTANQILEFARQSGLPVEKAYSSYVDLKRPFVVWNVFAAAPNSTALVTHCFPIAGCVGYKGYFKKGDAEAFAAELQAAGLDVYVGGVSAYSTLGWFDDPLLNTFIFRSDERLAAVLFHELAHKVLYLEGDTVFSESFATAVERYLLQRWLQERGQADLYASYLTSEQRRAQVIELILVTRDQLDLLYASEPDAYKAAKQQIIEGMKTEYAAIRSGWLVGDEFSGWMAQDLNNAHLGAIGAYQGQVAGFMSLLKNMELEAFFAEARSLAQLDKAARDQILAN